MTKRMLPLLLSFTLTLAAQTDKSRADLEEYLQLSGAAKAMEQMLSRETMERQMRTMMKPEEKPPEQRARMEEFITEFGKEWETEAQKSRQHLLDLSKATMAKYYNEEDIKALIAFFKTPAGRKLAEAGPKIVMEQMQAGQAWGQKLGAEIGARVGARIEQKYGK